MLNDRGTRLPICFSNGLARKSGQPLYIGWMCAPKCISGIISPGSHWPHGRKRMFSVAATATATATNHGRSRLTDSPAVSEEGTACSDY
jgi:hypothetical protein